jgi:hypothetical protein
MVPSISAPAPVEAPTEESNGEVEEGSPFMAVRDPDQPLAALGTSDIELSVVLRVIKATMYRSFELFGRMDPQATVHWITADKQEKEIAVTRVDWNGHLNPKWDHTCRGQAYPGAGSNVSLEFKVFEADVVGPATFCGTATSLLDELWDNPGELESMFLTTESKQIHHGPVRELKLLRKGEETGVITVEAILLKRPKSIGPIAPGNTSMLELSKVDPNEFVTPVQRVQVSGGTAPFFNLCLKAPEPGQSEHYYIGKDLAHAMDEINFYEVAMHHGMKGKGELARLLQFVPEYAGVLRAREEGKEEERDLLVMRNLKDGHKAPRLLDIKMGQKTGQAGWQGKSRTAALRQSIVDGITNSACEGFRLEGFDNRPRTLTSMDPLLDIGSSDSKKMQKKAQRVMLQRMPGAEMMMHYLDVHQELPNPGEDALQQVMGPSEVTELSLWEAVRQLTLLALNCRCSPVPQKWIGSSVALGFDCGELPRRSSGEEDIKKGAVVAIFDWGRSELNTVERHMQLSDSEQKDRSEFWCYYVGGVDRLAWEVARAYKHRYTTASEWKHVVFTIYDFDSLTANDFIGRVRVPVEETQLQKVSISDSNGEPRGELEFSMRWCAYPKGSRLRGAWQVSVVRAANLPAYDKLLMRGTVDPFVEVVAISSNGKNCFRQVSSVKAKCNTPEWNETFELPVVCSKRLLDRALSSNSTTLQGAPLGMLLPMEEEVHAAASMGKRKGTLKRLMSKKSVGELPKSEVDKAFADWVSKLDFAASEQIRKEGGDLSRIRMAHSGSGTSKLLPHGSVSSQCIAVVPSGGVAIVDNRSEAVTPKSVRTKLSAHDSPRKCCSRCSTPAPCVLM